MHALSDEVFDSPARLTPAVLQAAEMLGMYRAELARVLQLQCQDIGAFAEMKKLLEADTPAWRQACLFIRLYQSLYEHFQGEEVAIYHWLRAENKSLQGVPLLLIVDENKLAQVLDFCRHAFSLRSRTAPK